MITGNRKLYEVDLSNYRFDNSSRTSSMYSEQSNSTNTTTDSTRYTTSLTDSLGLHELIKDLHKYNYVNKQKGGRKYKKKI